MARYSRGRARRSHKVPDPSEAWWTLTAGGAEALSMGDRVAGSSKAATPTA